MSSSQIVGFVSQRIRKICLLRSLGVKYKAANISSLAVQYSEFGNAQNVLKYVKRHNETMLLVYTIEHSFRLVSVNNEASLSSDEVLLKHLVSPINPSDINMVKSIN
jgi:hypothetical protein